jgi:hypothetical protein
MQTVIDLLPYILGCYEVLSRVIPTEKNYSIVHKVFSALSFLSGFLNREKPIKKKGFFSILAILIVSSLFSCKTVEKIDCYSKSTFPLTYVTKTGQVYTVNIPYCDTVKLKTEAVPDTVQMKKAFDVNNLNN